MVNALGNWAFLLQTRRVSGLRGFRILSILLLSNSGSEFPTTLISLTLCMDVSVMRISDRRLWLKARRRRKGLSRPLLDPFCRGPRRASQDGKAAEGFLDVTPTRRILDEEGKAARWKDAGVGDLSAIADSSSNRHETTSSKTRHAVACVPSSNLILPKKPDTVTTRTVAEKLDEQFRCQPCDCGPYDR